MNTDLSSIIRTLLSAIGAYLLGKNLFGLEINESTWQEIVGAIMGIVSVIWSIKAKTLTIEMLQGVVRQVITFAGGLFVASGKLKGDTLVLVLGVVTTLLPAIYAWLSRVKSEQIEEGKISVAQLKK